jgi:hypothetical protein
MRHVVLSIFSTRVAHARLYTKDLGRQFPVRVSGVIWESSKRGWNQRKNGAIRRPPRWLIQEGSQSYWFAEAVSVSG